MRKRQDKTSLSAAASSPYRELARYEENFFATNQCKIRTPHGRKPLYTFFGPWTSLPFCAAGAV